MLDHVFIQPLMTTTLMTTHSPADRVLPCAAVRLSRCTAAAHFSNMKEFALPVVLLRPFPLCFHELHDYICLK
jgi:hypothetical protein